MSKEVQAAIGTQRQFAKQPESPYALSLNRIQAGSGISQRTDYDTQRLQSALGLLGKNIMEEKIADEKRTQEQAVLVNADKLLEGKTQEDLKKFDRIAALQNSTDEFDLTDNPYAMAALEKGIGKMASTYAKQQWANDPDAQKPKSVSEAVSLYHQYLQENRDAFSDSSIQNTTAFDAGYYEGAAQDTLKVADEADKRINEDRRQKMVMLGSSELQDLVYSGAKGENFSNGLIPALRKIQLGTRDREGFMKAVTPLADMIAAQDYTTERLDALGDFQYEEGLSLRQMVNFYPAYEKVAENFNQRVTADIIKRHTRLNNTIDLEGAYAEVDKLPSDFTSSGVPAATLPISQAENPDLANLSSTMKGALPAIGGAIYQLGFKDAMITSGYRNTERNAAVGGAQNSYHTKGDALDIYLGADVDEADAEKAKSYFSQYFGEVLFHDAGTGRHLHLADYKGGLQTANPKEQSAAAYNPQRKQKLLQIINTQAAYKERLYKQKMQDEKERVTLAVMGSMNPTEQEQIVKNSSLPAATKKTMLASITRQAKKAAKGSYGDTPKDKHYYNYEFGSGNDCYWRDVETYSKWYSMYKDPNIDPDSEEYQKMQKKANIAASRLNELREYKESKGILPSNKQQQHTEGTVPQDTPTLTQNDVDLAELKIWATSNPVNGSGVPMTDAEIENVVDKWAIDKGKDINAIHKEVFGE